MPRGGRREGAGRPAGAVAKRTREIADRAAAEGKTPLEVMLDNMRHFQQAAMDAEAILEGLTADEFIGAPTERTPEEQFRALLAEVKKAAGLRQMAQDCARDAAGYMHPRLAAIEHKGLNDKRNPDDLSSKELDARIAAILDRLEGIAGGAAGPTSSEERPSDVRKLN